MLEYGWEDPFPNGTPEEVRVDGYFGGSDVMVEMSAKEVFRQVCVCMCLCVCFVCPSLTLV